MSHRAVAWALTIPKKLDPTARLVLVYLAERTDDHGRGAWPSQATLAEHLETSERTVRRHLLALEERQLIVRGDQSAVAYLPADRRPVVWDLALPGVAGALYLVPAVPDGGTPGDTGDRPSDSSEGTAATEREDTGDQAGGHQRPVVDDRPDTEGAHGGTPVAPRGDTGVHDGGTPASDKPPTNHPQPPGEPPRASRPLAALPDRGAPTPPVASTATPQSAQTAAAAAGIAEMRARVRAAGGQR